MSSIQRITGTNSGLDVDTLVKTALKGDQSKIDKEVQNKKVMEYQQEQYRTIMSSGSDFYDKYLDILKTGSMVSSGTYQTQTYTSSNSDKVTAKGLAGAKLDNYTVNVTQLAQKATDSLALPTSGTQTKTIAISSVASAPAIQFGVVSDGATTIANYNKAVSDRKAALNTKSTLTDDEKQELADLNNNTITATYSQFTNTVTFTAAAFGGGGFTLDNHTKSEDKCLEATIKNSNGDSYIIDKDHNKTNDNAVTVDNVQFTFKGVTNSSNTNGQTITNSTINSLLGDNIKSIDNNSDGSSVYTLTSGSKITITGDSVTSITKSDGTTNLDKTKSESVSFKSSDGSTITIDSTGKLTTSANSSVKLTGATDVTSLKDTIVKFVDDYNTLLSSMNTKLFETRDKDYMPLTDEQKAAMTDSQVTAWEKKAQTGLLRKDSDLERIVSEMKSAMSTVISGSGLSLEKIGISPVKDYTSKNGMLTVDEDKLTKALGNNAGDVKDLFMRASTTTDPGGAMTQLKSVLNDEFKKSTSSLSKKAGLVGSSTESDNTLTNNIYKKKTLISELNSKLSDKENALYKKYSNLETAMENLNAQKSSLSSMLGTS